MDLWIRSQNKKELIKSNRIYQFAGAIYVEAKEDIELGNYKSRERALEVLDEIQDKIKTLLYLKPNELLRLDDIKAAKAYFEELNKQEFITCDNSFEIVPISTHVVVYEMPKE